MAWEFESPPGHQYENEAVVRQGYGFFRMLKVRARGVWRAAGRSGQEDSGAGRKDEAFLRLHGGVCEAAERGLSAVHGTAAFWFDGPPKGGRFLPVLEHREVLS